MEASYRLLADGVLLIHALIVAFIVLGLVLILAGGMLRWRWIGNRWFRIAHLLGIAIVVAQAWLGRLCPLTTLEMWLREQGGAVAYEQSFIQYWLQRLLYYDFPLWIFAIAYSLFALLVVAAWFIYPPRGRSK